MSAAPLPKVGQTRCYWALLSADLEFIYLDPVLQFHLEEQAPLLLAKSLLSFVHPEEQASAKLDLGGVLDSRTLHGSVTRQLLGHKGPAAPWADAEKIALDAQYMAVDIVINWAADGLVLCFIHAIVDLSPTDNDELHKTGWSNWCGTPRMDNDQIQRCYNHLITSVHTPPSISRVFQILDNSDGRALLLSWPPDPNQGTQHPNARDFAQLVENAQIGPSPSSSSSHDVNEAKTSCTRRYKALQTMSSVPGSQVESIFIPHGSVIFACHKLNSSPSRSTVSSSATMQQLGYASPSPYPSASSYYDAPQSSYALPPLSSSPAYTPYLCAPQRWSGSSEYAPSQQTQQQQWGSGSPSPSVPPAVSNLRAGSYPPPPPAQFSGSSAPGAPQGSPFLDLPRPLSPYPNPNTGSYSPGTASNDGSHGSLGDEMLVPPSRRRTSPVARGDNYMPSGRSAGNRPNGVLKCSSCKTTTSPEWRKGPSGKKELCNACGLRYARSRAKKEGHPQTQRRRKEKGVPTVAGGGITKREASATPPYHIPIPGTSASAPTASSMPTLRVGPGVGSLSASVGTSGEIYHHPHHQALEDTKTGLRLTPSPGPPGFVHYATGGSAAHHAHGHAPGHQFYGVPSPLSHTIPLEEESGSGSGPGHGGGGGNGLNGNSTSGNQQLPSMGAYVGRPPLSTMPAPSFERERGERERERDRERELPPPLALHGHRRILAQQG
ncbi:hypothetical protein H0H92_015541 [Tricholoma furcatifolium]|nr:hypothetical protein H0H92_015541 [Tricholoma furcatifolium]